MIFSTEVRDQGEKRMGKLIRRNEKNQPEDLGQWDPLRGTLLRMDPLRMVREMFQDPFATTGLLAETVFRPNLDVTETNDAFVINADLPGVRDEDIDVSVMGNRLTVNGRREAEEVQEGDRYVALERSYGSFSRSFVLPDSADLENIQAELNTGVLRIKVPKRGEMQGRKISIQSSARSPELQRTSERSESTERSESQMQNEGGQAQNETGKKAA
jgi:HSP20 family protein